MLKYNCSLVLIINSGYELKKIFLLLTLFLFGCDFDFQNNNLSRIEVSPEISKRLEEIINSNPSISAELLYQSKVKKNR